MERTLLWSALALGCVGWVAAALVAWADRSAAGRYARPALWMAAGLPVVVFVASLPSRPPFAAGHGWGTGFLAGGVGALLGGWVLARGAAAGLPSAARVAGPWFAALAAVAVPLLWMHGVVVDALVGVAIGWTAVSCVLYVGVEDSEALPGLVLSAGFAVTLCGMAVLGIYRGAVGFEHARWSAAGLSAATSVPIAVLLSALPTTFFARVGGRAPFRGIMGRLLGSVLRDDSARRRGGTAGRAVLAAAIVFVIARVVAAKALAEPAFWRLTAVGLALGLLLWWLAADAERAERTAERDLRAALAVLLLLVGFMVGAQVLAGYGVALVLLGAWLWAGFSAGVSLAPAAGATTDRSALRLLPVMLAGVLLLLYRVLGTRFADDLRSVSLSDHYALFGVLVGAILPSVLASYQMRVGMPGALARTVRLLVTGALALAIPGVVEMLWGAKCSLPLVAGLALAAAGLWRTNGDSVLPEEERLTAQAQPTDRRLLGSLMALVVALAMVQWTGHVLLVADLSRADKTRVLSWIVAIIVVAVLAADYGGRIRRRTHSRRGETAAAAGGTP